MEAIDEYLNGRPAVCTCSVTCIAVAAAGSVVHIVPGLPVNRCIVAASSCFMSRDPESGESARVTRLSHFLLPHPVSTCHRVPSLNIFSILTLPPSTRRPGWGAACDRPSTHPHRVPPGCPPPFRGGGGRAQLHRTCSRQYLGRTIHERGIVHAGVLLTRPLSLDWRG